MAGRTRLRAKITSPTVTAIRAINQSKSLIVYSVGLKLTLALGVLKEYHAVLQYLGTTKLPSALSEIWGGGRAGR